jgi:hypothetical protein
MSKIVFLLEEPSMEHLLRGLLPRVMPGGYENLNWVLVPHSGKSDLEASIPRKIRAWREPGVRFFIIRDQDAGECVKTKRQLWELARDAGRPDTMVRIACRELEGWYFGDLAALAEVYETPSLAKLGGRSSFRVPDAVVNPSGQLENYIPDFGKIDAARRMGLRLSLELLGPGANSSVSYRHVLASVRKLLAV